MFACHYVIIYILFNKLSFYCKVIFLLLKKEYLVFFK